MLWLPPFAVVLRPDGVISALGCGISWSVGVGQDEEPFSFVGRADVRCLDERFLDSVTEAFKVGLNNVEVSIPKVLAHILKEASSGSNLSDNSLDCGPEVAGVIVSCSPSRDTEWLTRVAANDPIHDSTPRVAIKGFAICPNRRVIQGCFFHCLDQDCNGRDFDFHITDCTSIGYSQSKSSIESTATCGDTEDGR